MAYQRLLSDACPDLDLRDMESTQGVAVSDEESLGSIKQQVRELSRLLERGVGCYYRDDKVYVRYHGSVTFQIVMNYQIPPEADSSPSTLSVQDNRIYMEGLTEFPVYTEDIVGQATNCLANFWFSFVEHGLSQVLSAHQIEISDSVPSVPDVRSPHVSRRSSHSDLPTTPDLLSG